MRKQLFCQIWYKFADNLSLPYGSTVILLPGRCCTNNVFTFTHTLSTTLLNEMHRHYQQGSAECMRVVPVSVALCQEQRTHQIVVYKCQVY
jgi:hypothetical protein